MGGGRVAQWVCHCIPKHLACWKVPGFESRRGHDVGPMACPQLRAVGTRTLGGVGKKGLPVEFARSPPVPGVLPPKGESLKTCSNPGYYMRFLHQRVESRQVCRIQDLS